ncbi:MAG: hypothetical protein C0466_17550 [Candidatus Accumulibacter sp.]|nr:hypothetical protein [Accumulibacter sp.]
MRRLAGVGAGDYAARGRVDGFAPSDFEGAIQQGMRTAIVLAEDVEASGFPLPFREKQDRLVWNGKTLVIRSVDDATRRIGGVVIAYVLELAGA